MSTAADRGGSRMRRHVAGNARGRGEIVGGTRGTSPNAGNSAAAASRWPKRCDRLKVPSPPTATRVSTPSARASSTKRGVSPSSQVTRTSRCVPPSRAAATATRSDWSAAALPLRISRQRGEISGGIGSIVMHREHQVSNAGGQTGECHALSPLIGKLAGHSRDDRRRLDCLHLFQKPMRATAVGFFLRGARPARQDQRSAARGRNRLAHLPHDVRIVVVTEDRRAATKVSARRLRSRRGSRLEAAIDLQPDRIADGIDAFAHATQLVERRCMKDWPPNRD